MPVIGEELEGEALSGDMHGVIKRLSSIGTTIKG